MQRSIWTMTAVIALGVALGACGSDGGTTDGATVTTVVDVTAVREQLDPAAGAALLVAEADITIIDVRTPEEFATVHLEGAVNVDVEASDFDARIGELDPDGTYAVYCHSGRRSALAAARMAELGLTDVHDLGGIEAWVAAGNPVVSG